MADILKLYKVATKAAYDLIKDKSANNLYFVEKYDNGPALFKGEKRYTVSKEELDNLLKGYSKTGHTHDPADINVNSSNRFVTDTDGLDLVKFTFKNDPNKKEHVGVLAQEIEKKYPNTVATSKDGTKSVNYTEFLLLELNKLRNEVSDMKKEINELKYGSKKG